MSDNVNTIIGILALYGAWYGTYRYFAHNSAAYFAAHEIVHQQILNEAAACSEKAILYVELDPRGGYVLTHLGQTADQSEIEAFRRSLRDLRDKIQLNLVESPGPWRFRFATRWKFYGNVRQWLQIPRVCDSINLRLSGNRNPASALNL